MTPQRLHHLTGSAADAADRLLGLAANVPLAGIERSCKFSPGQLHRERLLLGQASERLLGTPLHDAHMTLNMPVTARTAYETDRRSANFMYLGFDGSDDKLNYRIYLEFPVNVAQYVNDATGQSSKALLARGYKWDALGTPDAGHDVTDYWWAPRLTVDQILHRLVALCPPQTEASSEAGETALNASRALTREAIELARHRSNALDWMYLEATEPGSNRHSFDLNLYEAGLTLGELEAPVRALAEALQIARPQVDAFLDAERASSLGHLSGGWGRDGLPFLTVYYTDAET